MFLPGTESQIPAEVSSNNSPSILSPLLRGSPFPSSTPGYGENGHEPYVARKIRSCLILKNPVSDAAGEERNGHFPWGERGDISVTCVPSTPLRISPCPSPFTTVQKAGAELPDRGLFGYRPVPGLIKKDGS